MKVPFGNLAAEFAGIREDILGAILPVLERGSFVLGTEGASFEQQFSRFSGIEQIVGCGNGTDAITLALMAAGVSEGAEVITNANTCVPTVAGIRDAGCAIRVVDCDPHTLQMDAAALADAITDDTRAVVAVHLYGTMCDIGSIDEICRCHDLVLIEDCAQAHGASMNGVPAGATGLLSTWSFYPSKNLGAYGDGGAIATQDAALAEQLKRLRNYGQRIRYFHDDEGRNSRLDEIQAAILSAKLKHLDSWVSRRRTISALYDDAFRGTKVRVPRVPGGGVSGRHLYPVRVDGARRDAIRAGLAARGVETLIHYPVPIHLQPAYRHFFTADRFPNAEAAAAELFSLPLYPQLTDEEVHYVAEQVLSIVEG